MGDVIAMGDVTQKKSAGPTMPFDGDAFGTAVAEAVKGFVAREVASFRSEFELRVKMLEQKGTLEYVGTFEPGRQYARGNFVTHFGSLWHCNGATKESPGGGSPNWTLAAKRGRTARTAADERTH
jgi:hypothetical protein